MLRAELEEVTFRAHRFIHRHDRLKVSVQNLEPELDEVAREDHPEGEEGAEEAEEQQRAGAAS